MPSAIEQSSSHPPSPLQPVTRFAVVTGASSGIGEAVARELARRGWGTFLLARRLERLETLAKELRATAPSTPLFVDLADPGAAQAVASRILSMHGPVDALVNNAGFGIYEPFLDHSVNDHRRLMQVNYHSPLSLMRAFLPSMRDRGSGTVVNVSSMSAKMGPWGHSGYAASKAALRALTETLDAEFSPHGVRLSCLFPGIVDTPYFREPRMQQLFEKVKHRAIPAERCARAVCDLVDAPRIWRCEPGFYRMLDALCALNARLAHALVARGSRPSSLSRVRPEHSGS